MVNAANGSVLQTDARFPGVDEQTKYANKVRPMGTPVFSPREREHGMQVAVWLSKTNYHIRKSITPEKYR